MEVLNTKQEEVVDEVFIHMIIANCLCAMGGK